MELKKNCLPIPTDMPFNDFLNKKIKPEHFLKEEKDIGIMEKIIGKVNGEIEEEFAGDQWDRAMELREFVDKLQKEGLILEEIITEEEFLKYGFYKDTGGMWFNDFLGFGPYFLNMKNNLPTRKEFMKELVLKGRREESSMIGCRIAKFLEENITINPCREHEEKTK